MNVTPLKNIFKFTLKMNSACLSLPSYLELIEAPEETPLSTSHRVQWGAFQQQDISVEQSISYNRTSNCPELLALHKLFGVQLN